MKKKYLIVLIILLGLFLRIYNLNSESLWSDEGYSINEAKFSIHEIISHMGYNPNPPLYLITLHFWINLFGDSAFSVRFLSFIFSSISLVLLFLLTKRIFDKKTAVFSTLILSLSTFHIYYAQEARSYALFSMLGLLSYYSFYKFNDWSSKRNILYYLISTTLMIYTHVFGIFIMLSQVISIKKKLLKKWFFTLTFIGVMYLPYISVLFQQTMHVSNETWRNFPSFNDFFYALSRPAGNYWLLITFMFLLILYFFKSKNKWLKRTLVSWWSITIILPFLISITIVPIFFPKYTIAASFGLYIIVARGIEKIKYKHLKYVVILAIILLSLFELNYYYKINQKEDWHSLSKYLDENVGKIDRIIFYPGFTDDLMYQYYTKENHTTYVLTYYARELNESDLERIEPMLGEYENMWLVLSHNQYDGRLIKKINSSYGKIEEKNFTKIQVYKFSQK